MRGWLLLAATTVLTASGVWGRAAAQSVLNVLITFSRTARRLLLVGFGVIGVIAPAHSGDRSADEAAAAFRDDIANEMRISVAAVEVVRCHLRTEDWWKRITFRARDNVPVLRARYREQADDKKAFDRLAREIVDQRNADFFALMDVMGGAPPSDIQCMDVRRNPLLPTMDQMAEEYTAPVPPAADPIPGLAPQPAPTAKAPYSRALPPPSHGDAPAESVGHGQSYDQGYADRMRYQGWRNSFPPGRFQEGVFYWEGNRSLPGVFCPSDYGHDFYAGCVADRRMIAPYDARRLSDPAYRAGWNAVPATD